MQKSKTVAYIYIFITGWVEGKRETYAFTHFFNILFINSQYLPTVQLDVDASICSSGAPWLQFGTGEAPFVDQPHSLRLHPLALRLHLVF